MNELKTQNRILCMLIYNFNPQEQKKINFEILKRSKMQNV